MRQILYGEQWIHPETPGIIQELFRCYGKRVQLKKGTEVRHGKDGDVTLLLSGAAMYNFWDWKGQEHVSAIILPGRTMGDIDAAGKNVANVCATMIEDGEGLEMPYRVWHREIYQSVDILEEFTTNVILKQECHIEALLSCFTMEIDKRLQTLFHSLIRAYREPDLEGWNELPLRLNTVLLSKIISSSRTSVSLALSKWEEEGKIKKQKGRKPLQVHGQLFTELYDWWES